MLHNLPNANQYFAINDFPSASPWLSRDDILFVTGYSLFRDPVSLAAGFLMRSAQEHGAKVVFDLVPHRLESIGQAPSLLKRIKDSLLKPLDLCIGEFRTWSCLFEQPFVTTPSHADLIEIGRRASAISRLTCIRYGFENCEMQSLVAGDQLLFDAPTTYRTLSPQQRVGFSELLTASLIQQIFLGRHSWIYASGESFTVPLSVLEGSLASTPRQARILDVGCGYGRLFAGLQSLGFQNLFGIDSSDSMVEAARRQYHEIPVYHGSVDTLAAQGKEFDVCLLVAMLTTLQKDDDLQQLLYSLWRILRVGGRLLICDFLINDDAYHRHQYSLYRRVFSEAAYGTFFSANGSVNRHRSIEEIQTTLGRLFNVEFFSLASLPTLTGKQSHGFVTVCTKS